MIYIVDARILAVYSYLVSKCISGKLCGISSDPAFCIIACFSFFTATHTEKPETVFVTTKQIQPYEYKE